MPAGKEKEPLSGSEQRAKLSKEPEPLKDGGGEGAGLPRFEQLSLFGEDEPAAPAAGPVSDGSREATPVEAGCSRPQRALRSASAGASEESLRAEEAQAGARGQKKVVRQKLSREEIKKSRDKFLRWAEAINAMLEERLQRTGKTREEILFEILGSVERKRMVAELKRRLAEGLAKELEKEPEKGPEKKPGKEHLGRSGRRGNPAGRVGGTGRKARRGQKALPGGKGTGRPAAG